MPGINTQKVIIGGLLAGLVFNVLDFVTNTLILAADFRANFTRLGLDPAAVESASGIATWVIIDFLLGILAVFTYAAIRPRFGPGAKTAVYAGLLIWAAISLVVLGFTQSGVFAMGLFVKASLLSLITSVVGTVVGARTYKEP